MPRDVWALADGYLSRKLSLMHGNQGEENVLLVFHIPEWGLSGDSLLLSTSQLCRSVEESASRSR